MRKSPQPRCFVASAFGPKDVNTLYDRQIRPLLRHLGITPIIINRRQSNEDLNIQIISNLRESDFCIADLTYARPSVYYEAGFAQRSCEVIYTARKDHLKPGQPEHLRVHFDLQMKPIVTWKDPSDPTFRTRLEKRVRATFLRQWNKDQKLHQANETAIRQFALVPQFQRIARLRQTTIAAFRKVGFSTWHAPSPQHRAYKRTEITFGFANNAFSVAKGKNIIRVASVHAYPSLRKPVLEDLRQRLSPYRLREDLSPYSPDPEATIPACHVVLSLSPVRAHTIESVFTALKPEDPPVHYTGFMVLRDRFSEPEKRAILSVDWIFLGGIRSLQELKPLLDKYVIEPIRLDAA